jgi:hypothetical protein
MTRDAVDHDKEVTYSPMDWVILAVSIAFQAFLLIVIPEFAWVGLPFWTTYLVKCLRQL